MNKILIPILLLSCLSIIDLHAQRFKAAGVLGTNVAQIDGDNLYGFKKIGLHTGVRLSYVNNKTFDLALEMLYSQRGSSVNFVNNLPEEKISLNYFELPVIVSLRDWYIEDKGYYKVRADGGLSYGYLFGAKSSGIDVNQLKTHDLSWLLGIGLNINKTLGFSLRYTSSFMDLYKDTPDIVSYKSYFITFRSEVNF